jgi:hypothetical protein
VYVLLDRFLPEFDASVTEEIAIDATPGEAYDAISTADIRDPVTRALFAVRELPHRVVRHVRGEPAQHWPVTFRDLLEGTPGWIQLAEEPGSELVVGSVGRFWRHDYGRKQITVGEFADFCEGGYARLAVSFSVRPNDGAGSILRYEARTAATDDAARRRFHRYWRIIRPGVAIVMARSLRRIRADAERRHKVLATMPG